MENDADDSDWFEEYRLSETYVADVYNSIDPCLRARLKTAIAFQFHRHKKMSQFVDMTVKDHNAGFASTIKQEPAAWTLVILDPRHRAPARLLAALIPAILSGVGHFIILCPGGKPSRRNCLALELAGLENIYVLPEHFAESGQSPTTGIAERILASISPDHPFGHGRALLFPAPDSSVMWPLWKNMLKTKQLPYWEDECPEIMIRETASSEQARITRWSQADAVFHSYEAGQALKSSISACYLPTNNLHPADMHKYGQVYGPGLESCWLHQNLPEKFFINIRQVFSLICPDESV